MRKLIILSLVLSFLVLTMSCRKNQVEQFVSTPQPQLSTSEWPNPIVQSFTGDMNTMICNQEDEQDEAVNKAAFSILMALEPMMISTTIRENMLGRISEDGGGTFLYDLIDLGIIAKTSFENNIENSIYYDGTNVKDWIETSYIHTVQHYPIINVPNIENVNFAGVEYFLSIGEESNSDFTVDGDGLVHVYKYIDGIFIEELVINEDYANTCNIPMFVISPAVDEDNLPPIPTGYETIIAQEEPGDSTLFESEFNKTVAGPDAILTFYEQYIGKRMERWGASEIVTGWISNNKLSSGSPYTPQMNINCKTTAFQMETSNIPGWEYRWTSFFEWHFSFHQDLTWNIYEMDWARKDQILCSVRDVSNNNIHYAKGHRKYFDETYAWYPLSQGSSDVHPYPLIMNQNLWSRVVVFGTNGIFRVWHVNP